MIAAELTAYANENDILLGVCDASRLDYLLPLLTGTRHTPFTDTDPERRINPRAIMPAAQSIIVIGVGHPAVSTPPSDTPRGRLSAIAAQADYHPTVIRLLNVLAERIHKTHAFSYKVFADAGHLNERALAVKAGLGFIGRNAQVISNRFGSFFNIGYMLTDLALTPNTDIPRCECGECRRCVDACAGQALNGGFNPYKCVSYLTQKKGELTPAETAYMQNWLYGCDTCQIVCPFNQHVPRVPRGCPPLDECIGITDAQFAHEYAGTALYWRGAEVFRRNAAIALRNARTQSTPSDRRPQAE